MKSTVDTGMNTGVDSSDFPVGGRYNWGAPVPQLAPVLLNDAYLHTSVGFPLQTQTFPQPVSDPEDTPEDTDVPSLYRDSRERRLSRKRLRRAKNVYGRGWYLSRTHAWWLSVIWIGSCLLMSSVMTLAWLAFIGKLS